MGVDLKHSFEWTLFNTLSSLARTLQFTLAVTVCALYGVDLSNARQQGKYMDGKWVFAEIVGGLSAVGALVYLVPFAMKISFLFVWDVILWILWLILFSIFGQMYIGENPEGNGGIQRMKNAVWVDLANMLLWFMTATAMSTYWWIRKQSRSMWTGRAAM